MIDPPNDVCSVRSIRSIGVIDSHTEGEPTRVVVDGWPEPAGRTMAERRRFLAEQQDELRAAVACEPRGHDAMVGALLTEPVETGSVAGVIFFNNVDVLWMCGHGTIGVVKTLQHQGRVGAGEIRLDTAVGTVSAWLEEDGAVRLRNLPAWVHQQDVEIEVPGLGLVRGDVAWGGNWFFLTELPAPRIELANAAQLTRAAETIRAALGGAGITGRDGGEIDHVELFGPADRTDAQSKNFVLCPGSAYDRSPCGTGTSAKMAALRARGKLAAGQRYRQESITGSVFEGWLEEGGSEREWIPHLRGRAWIVAESKLRLDPSDPFRFGFTAATKSKGGTRP